MSARKQLVLAPLAQDDYADIHLYTEEAWGEAQWADYEEALVRALDALADNPLLGRARDDLRPGARTLRVREHVIVYDVTPDLVRVARILHGRRDLHRALT